MRKAFLSAISAALFVAIPGSASALDDRPSLATVTCKCSCLRCAEENVCSDLGDTKEIAAPQGDPSKCGNFNGAKCKVSGGGPNDKLSKCEAVVERKIPPAKSLSPIGPKPSIKQ